jgi:hypothetical protein
MTGSSPRWSSQPARQLHLLAHQAEQPRHIRVRPVIVGVKEINIMPVRTQNGDERRRHARSILSHALTWLAAWRSYGHPGMRPTEVSDDAT